MVIAQLTADMSLAATLGPVVKSLPAAQGTVRGALAWLAGAGFTGVQLDATLSGIRPRELSKRARQDLAALFLRQNLRLAGVDLFLPARHYVDPAHVDRAMAATTAAIELAADLGRVPVSLALPVKEVGPDVRDAIVACADGHGVSVAVHGEGALEELWAWVTQVDGAVLGAALDPAAVLSQGGQPDMVVHRLSSRLTAARLSDVTQSDGGGLRCPVGQGELDVLTYRIALDLAPQRRGMVTLDLRGVEDVAMAARRGLRAWERARP